MAKLQLPFELQKPDASTFVTQASEIGYNGKGLNKFFDDLFIEVDDEDNPITPSNTTALCGNAICGYAICGTN